MEMNKENKKEFYTLMGILITFTILTSYWVVTKDNAFLFDDYAWLNTVKFKSISDIFTFLPTSKYNDRPVGALFIKILYNLFNFEYTKHHSVLLLLHILNTMLVVNISNMIFKDYFKSKIDKKYWRYSIIAGAVFGIYPKTLMAIQWDASIFDLLGATFVLLTMFFYMKHISSNKYNYFYMIISILSYYLGLRTKEMVLCLPIIILIYEMHMKYSKKEPIKISLYSLIMNVIMLLYSLLLFSLKSVENITESTSNPYFLSFNPFKMILGAIKYILLYFDLKNSGFTYGGTNTINILGLIFVTLIILFGIYRVIRNKNITIFVSLIAIGLSMAPVLPMINMQHVLYLYIPSIFVGIAVAIVIMQIKEIKTNISLIIFMSLLYLLSYTRGIQEFRGYWIGLGKKDMKVIQSIKSISKVPPNTNIYLNGDNLDDYTVFYYGPGFINNLVFNDESITTHINSQDETKITPYVVWEYHEDGIKELARDREIVIEIQSVHPAAIDSKSLGGDGKVPIGLTGINLNQNSVVVIEGNEMETIYSEEFISCTLPKEIIQGKSDINVYVKDTINNVISNVINVPIVD